MLKRVFLGAVVIALALAAAAYGHIQGFFVSARTPAEIDALLAPHDEIFRPEGTGPFPTVVFFHGCGGLRGSLREWGRELADAGLLVVATNSLAGRNLDWAQTCNGRKLLGSERAGDVWVSIARARARSDVDPERVILMGWSHGAWSLMDLFALADGELPANLSAAPASPFGDVSGLVVFYPYCGFGAGARAGWPHDPATLMLLAGEDSITSAEECRVWGEGREGVETHVYPGVDHGFDQGVVEPEWPSTHDVPAASDSRRRVLAFIRSQLGPAGIAR
ncbi:MAG: dienelactone hydrolase family protein [Deltaproteobacteria bacterium]|nr:dienelactone hydrolase family protein [Deltaproteobacteria bacterium]MBW2447936.1 dienelactone hydrolase family protein [Deltaproteobacteria bacterium]